MQDTQKRCENCWKAPELCLCDSIQALPAKLSVLILQHPQESRNPKTTARLVSLSLPNAVHKVGFSWRSLAKALGRPADPKRWAVLYLGTQKNIQNLKSQPFQILSSKLQPLEDPDLEGIVLLDGNWSQSKTLWWRNPWLLKLNRLVLNPTTPSLFGEVAKQPRKNCLSTLEAVAETCSHVGEAPSVYEGLQSLLKKHIERIKLSA
jgi:DTW domain-containing protein